MTNEEFRQHVEQFKEVSLGTLLRKNAMYAKDNADALHNFKLGAAMCNGTPAQAAWGYMTKHLVALHDKVEHDDFTDLDDLEEKCQDIVNYITFIYVLGIERNKQYCKQVNGQTSIWDDIEANTDPVLL